MELRFWRKKETREDTLTLEDLLLQAGIKQDNITRDMALNIPTLSGCVELISNTVASLPIKLYQELDGKVNEIKDDIRLKLLNNDTGDTLDAFQFKKAMVQDYLLMGNGYAYIKREKGAFESLHYVKQESASININADPIFKQYDILVNGENYKPYEFIKLLRNSRDGATGTGIVESNNKLLAVAYNSLDYENILAKTGGNKKGFIKALSKLTDEAIAQLKEQWNKMYSKNSENCVVLNNGLEFQESSSTPTELQMNENKVSNGNEICKILNVPPSMITGDGKANESDYEKFVKMAILPILNSFISALNRELLKGDILKRFQAYEIALKNGFLGVNEVRYEEDKPEIEAFNDVIKLGLSDVLYNTKTGDIYTPNTDKSSNMKGGENIEN